MAKTPPDVVSSDPAALTHSPFATLARNATLRAKIVPIAPARAGQAMQPLPRVSMFCEARGKSGKVVTRISGLPAELREIVALRLCKALGCEGEVEAEDVILAGSLKERAATWFERIGDLRRLLQEKPAASPKLSTPAPPPEQPSPSSSASGTRRKDVRPGLRVAIVLKADQPSGELTQGVVRDILTSSAEHPHGIKVRLLSGQVGRVKIIYR